MISQAGGGYSWRSHASLNRITLWHQDLVRDADGRFLYENPAVAALLNLLSLPVNREAWIRRAVLDSWRSLYFDFSELRIDSSAGRDFTRRQGVSGIVAGFESFEIWEERRVVNVKGEVKVYDMDPNTP